MIAECLQNGRREGQDESKETTRWRGCLRDYDTGGWVDRKRRERLSVTVSDWGSAALCSHRLTQMQLN